MLHPTLPIVLASVLAASCGSITATSDAGGGDASKPPDVAGEAGHDAGGGIAGATGHDAGADAAPIEHPLDTRQPSSSLNLLPNGDFANGLADGWNVTPTGTAAQVAAGRLCTTLTPNARAYIGWGPPDPAKPLMLAGGTRLLFSYKASTTANLLVFTPQVGHTSAPFTADFTQPEVLPVGAVTTISHEFVVPAAGDTSAGIVFQAEAATAATVCIDDVYLGPP